MIIIRCLFINILYICLCISITHCSPDIAKLEKDQKILLENLKHNKNITDEMYSKLKFLDRKDNLKVNVDVFDLCSELKLSQCHDSSNYVKVDNNYAPPIIVLLPEDSTSREKWEYAVTLKCLGQSNFDAFTNIHNTRMAKMASISGTTVSEINAEIKETEKELDSVKLELESLKEQKKNLKPAVKNDFKEKTRQLHLDHNIKLLNREIHVMEIKLEKLKKKLKIAVLFGQKDNKTPKNNVEEENVDQGNEDEYESGSMGEVKSSSKIILRSKNRPVDKSINDPYMLVSSIGCLIAVYLKVV
ncbi:conserved hypothetical protein [Theileria orientalis strain Shintoku]|uniref:Uncharacterized protein n=1 Tax=Theileria orientalis strain Shintoku TaxID=869250 RepID=J4C7R4_THEOR|nr:conserved hypothetical protein [Theileria orientalis strain Shintoku]BAM39493.1 conserved hypothetical protein [Theileria orientalis strain Shintoku]|eukprot:XP_009689794.1 conserved hypothetical protein [Theileria orientalis strain Shintoku]